MYLVVKVLDVIIVLGLSEGNTKSIQYCDKGHYTSHNKGCVSCDITNNKCKEPLYWIS